MKYTLSSLTAVGVLVASAIPALAATPQEIINSGLKTMNTDGASRIAGEVTVKVRETRYRTATKISPESTDMTIRFEQRNLPKQDGVQNSEGRFALTKFEMKADGETMSLPSPINLTWKYLQPAVYGYVENVPQVLVDSMKDIFDISPYLNQWYKVVLPTEAKDMLTGDSRLKQVNVINDLTKELADKQAIKVLSTEKTYTNAASEKMARVRITANRTVLAKERLADLKEAYKITDRKARNARVAEINKEYTELLKELNKLRAVANVNLTTNKIERLEASVTQSDPKKECNFVGTSLKQVCKTVGMTNVTILAGVSFLKTDVTPIAVPAEAKVLDAVQGLLQAE